MFNTSLEGGKFAYSSLLSPPYGDFRFVSSNLTDELRYEVENWDTKGNSRVWVEVPVMAGTNTTVWAYWGKAGLGVPAYATNTTVWSNGYLQIVAWEEAAEFNKAISLCTALLNQGGDEARLVLLRSLMSTLRQEKKTAGTLAPALDLLDTQKDIARQELMKDERVATLMLRKALREHDGGILTGAAALLIEMNDPATPGILLSRLKT